ncbi:coiled coil domain containing protein Alhambra isoform X3 [Leptinotarsa decemlineata]|uniref:coiled coil domain containing protein Alhambra isoform X3 n=1 Tax=Leptinotarsa decemlineata TaxID=7539 RepID=UPI003D30A079
MKVKEMVGRCCVCSDERGWFENPLVYCDGQSCTVAVHQACYGIVSVPVGPWYCRKCESQERSVKVKCELCPSRYGALKRTDNSGWAHVVCALYIPEVRFGNVTTMEPIQLQLIPAERFNKVCYICDEKKRPSSSTVGACMQCNKAGCRQQFHVTCAQGVGLLCEEAGNYLDNVKYCGYCQHHYSKLKKVGNVKWIPPYKPVANESYEDSNSDKETDSAPSNSKRSPPTSGKKKTNVATKQAPSKTSSKSGSTSHQKSVHNNNKNTDKSKSSTVKSAKSEESASSDAKKESDPPEQREKEAKDSGSSSSSSKGAKKRKANSRTPTPVRVVVTEVSVVTAATSASSTTTSSEADVSVTANSTGKNSAVSDSSVDKPKKPKVENTQSMITNQPVVALTSISTVKSVSPTSTTTADIVAPTVSNETALPTSSIIQTVQSQSLVVSVPLVNTSLSPHRSIINNQTSVLTATPLIQETSNVSVASAERRTPVISSDIMTGGNSNQELPTPDMSSGGLKITFEKQMDSINTEEDMELELEPTPSRSVEVPAKRGRSQSQSNEKTDRSSRSRKRNSNLAVATSASGSSSLPAPSVSTSLTKRSSRSQQHHHVTPSPPEPPGAFAAISQSQLKESPPSSPSSESQSNPPPSTSRGRAKNRRSAPASVNLASGSSKDGKDVKLFQNGISAPHMLGNQLNPTSTMHSKMSDHLNAEIEAHSIFNPSENNSGLTGPQLHHRVVQSARASSTGSSTASGGSGLSSMLGGGGGNIPQTLDQLLERQWEQGSQFLMEQAQHFDIASLLSCLHQLRAENLRLEEHVSSLLQRRDHLLAVNARLAIPLTGQPAAAPLSTHPHPVNNIHPTVAASHGDVPRPSRHNGGSAGYPNHPQGSAQHPPVENGLPPEAYPQNAHRRSPSGGQPSPTMVVRRERGERSDRDSESHHHSSSKSS